jgi:hypothetical protein
MRKMMWLGVIVFGLSLSAGPAEAQVSVEVGVQLPPPLFFPAPPQVVVLPDTYVYVVPDIEQDVYFFDGFWWRPWGGHWYRSSYYDRGWGFYSSVPGFYFDVPQNWRHEYHSHHWNGQPWNYTPISHQQVQEHWSSWKNNKHWEKNEAWGVKGLKPRPQPQAHVNAPHPQKMQQSPAQQPKANGHAPKVQQTPVHGNPASQPQAHALPSSQHQVQGHQSGSQPQMQKGKAKKGGKGRRGR